MLRKAATIVRTYCECSRAKSPVGSASVRVDRIAKQKELHDRQGDDQTQCHWIASNLDPFLCSTARNRPKENPFIVAARLVYHHPRGSGAARAGAEAFGLWISGVTVEWCTELIGFADDGEIVRPASARWACVAFRRYRRTRG